MSPKQAIGGPLVTGDGSAIPLSKAIRAGDYIFASGQLAFSKDGKISGTDIEAQTRQTLENVKAVLAQADADMADVVKATCWIADEKDFQRFNKVYAEYFPVAPPARSCIPSKLLFNALVEIEVLAYKPMKN
jgi:2-iminobutanoate/2-iminopropanoate deaminase